MRTLALVAQGLTNRQIASVFGTTPRVIHNYLEQARHALGARPYAMSRLDLVKWYRGYQFRVEPPKGMMKIGGGSHE